MTVSTTTNKQSYTGNGATTLFGFTIPFIAASDLLVYVNGTLKTLTTDYTISGSAPYPSGANVTFVSAPANLAAILIVRARPYTQTLDLVENDPLPAESVEQLLGDHMVMLIQQLKEITDRSFTLSITDTSGASLAIPTPVASQLLGWNSSATGLTNYSGTSSVTLSSAMTPVVQAATLALGRTAMGVAASGANTDITSLNAPALGSATMTTQTAGDSSTKGASTAFVSAVGRATGVTQQTFLSGSGTYTTPANVKWLRIVMAGGGGGGSGSSTTAASDSGSGGTGGNTTFGTALLAANGGVGGVGSSNTSPGGVGGTASLGTGPIGIAIQGGQGGGVFQTSGATAGAGGMGGQNALGGGAGTSGQGQPGPSGIANTGGGGAGGGGSISSNCGAGGGAGGYINAIILSPSATYSYAVGAAGTAGTAGTGGGVGGAGGSGGIRVEEHYVL